MPVPMWPKLSRTHYTPCAERCWTIPHTAQTCHCMTSMCLAPSKKYQRTIQLGRINTSTLQWCSDSSSSPGSSLQRLPSAGVPTGCSSQCPVGVFVMSSTPLPRTIPKWVSFEQASYPWLQAIKESSYPKTIRSYDPAHKFNMLTHQLHYILLLDL
jgi:hypothetical protein